MSLSSQSIPGWNCNHLHVACFNEVRQTSRRTHSNSLPPSPAAMDANQLAQETTRASESGAITRVLGNPGTSTQELANPEVQIDLIIESSFGESRVDYFQSDTSDVEDLLDRSGPKCLPAN